MRVPPAAHPEGLGAGNLLRRLATTASLTGTTGLLDGRPAGLTIRLFPAAQFTNLLL